MTPYSWSSPISATLRKTPSVLEFFVKWSGFGMLTPKSFYPGKKREGEIGAVVAERMEDLGAYREL